MTGQQLADLVAADAFRETVIPKADGVLHGGPAFCGWVIVDAYLAGVKAEREACAKVADAIEDSLAEEIAERIRARSK